MVEDKMVGVIIPNKPKVDIPNDVMEEILSRLPAKSLIRFTLVNKKWRSLISQPRFVQSQLKHILYLQPNQHKITIMSLGLFDSSLSYIVNEDGYAIEHKYNLPVATPFLYLGFCNGMLSIGIYSESLDKLNYTPILWNPLLNDYKEIPLFVTDGTDWLGFGYESYTEDYKFVRVDHRKHEAEVYSLKSGSTRMLPFKHHLQLQLYTSDYIGAVYKGSLYWLFGGLDIEFELTEFDLRYETFRFIKLPNYTLKLPFWGAKVNNVRDCLSIIFYKFNDDYFNLVTMNEDSVNGISWSPVETIQYPEGMKCYPISIMTNGEILLRVMANLCPSRGREPIMHKLILYNPQQRTEQIIWEGDRYQFEYTTYIETLVSPSRLNDVFVEESRPRITEC